MITRDPYEINHASSPWAESPYPETTDKERKYLEDARREYEICQYCILDDCNPKRSGCLLSEKQRRHTNAQETLSAMWAAGASWEDIAAATGYTARTVKEYVRQLERKKKTDPCPTCRSRKICEAYGGTCNEKEIWRGHNNHDGAS